MGKTTRQLALTSSIALALGVGTGFSAVHQSTERSCRAKDVNTGMGTLTGSADSAANRSQVGLNNGAVRAGQSAIAARIESANERTEQVASDSWTTAKVNASLLLTQAVDDFEIAVATIDGVVSLRGVVDSAAEREVAVQVAQGIRGVRKVDAGGLKVGWSNRAQPSKRMNHQGATR